MKYKSIRSEFKVERNASNLRSCKKMRDDKGYWNQIENYIREHSDARFSHGICPQCDDELYPGFVPG